MLWGHRQDGLENAELLQIASVTRKETGTAGMSALGLELRPLPQGTKIPARHRDCWGSISQPQGQRAQRHPVCHSACV